MASSKRLVEYPDSDSEMVGVASPEATKTASSSTGPPPNAPTGPKAQQFAFKPMSKPGWQFVGVPSPQAIHYHILHKKSAKQYYSITIMQPPAMPWTQLSSNQNKETRTCFHTGSRIHLLDCGHMIATQNDAEPCAQNCQPPMSRISCTDSVLPTPFASPINILRASTAKTLKAHITTLTTTADPLAQQTFKTHVDALCAVWTAQDATLRPTADLLSGNFSCAMCRAAAHRTTFPAAHVAYAPYHCIVVGRDEHDLAILTELGKGVQPREPLRNAVRGGSGAGRRAVKRLGPANDRGQRRAGAVGGLEGKDRERERETTGEKKRRVRDGRHSAARRREKDAVMAKLREENLTEELNAMGFEGW